VVVVVVARLLWWRRATNLPLTPPPVADCQGQQRGKETDLLAASGQSLAMAVVGGFRRRPRNNNMVSYCWKPVVEIFSLGQTPTFIFPYILRRLVHDITAHDVLLTRSQPLTFM